MRHLRRSVTLTLTLTLTLALTLALALDLIQERAQEHGQVSREGQGRWQVRRGSAGTASSMAIVQLTLTRMQRDPKHKTVIGSAHQNGSVSQQVR